MATIYSNPRPLTFQSTENIEKQKQFLEKIKAPEALDFGPIESSGKVRSPALAQPKALFDSPFIKDTEALMVYVRKTFPDMPEPAYSTIEKRLRQILPLSSKTISEYGSKYLSENATKTIESGVISRRVGDIDATEILGQIEEALKPTKGIFKIFGSMISPELAIKKVKAVKIHIDAFTLEIDQHLSDIKELGFKLLNCVIVINAVSNVMTVKDEFKKGLEDKRIIIQQATTQNKLSQNMLEGLKNQISSINSTIDLLMNVTIPALAIVQENQK